MAELTLTTCTALIFLVFSVSGVRSSESGPSHCNAGQYKSADGSCRPCPPGHFMPEARHSINRCRPCAQREAASEIVTCDPKNGNPVPCEPGHFHDANLGGLCTRCTSCVSRGMPQVKPCTRNSNAVCCPFRGMTLVNSSQVLKDTERCIDTGLGVQSCCCPVGFAVDDQCQAKGIIQGHDPQSRVGQSLVELTCGYNQYLSQEKKTCQPCQPCSYLTYASHREPRCKPCSTTSSNPRTAYCPKSCRDREANVILRLVISGVIVVTFPLVLVPLSLIIVDVAKKYNVI